MENGRSIETLRRLLADTYVLLVKTQGVHWNVTGSDFFELHQLTEQNYTELFAAVDEIAEALRALGSVSPSTMAGLLAASGLKEGTGSGAKEMVATILAANEQIANGLAEAIESGKLEPGTEDLCTARLRAHKKAAWMWRSVGDQRDQPAAAPSATKGVAQVAPAAEKAAGPAGARTKKEAKKAKAKAAKAETKRSKAPKPSQAVVTKPVAAKAKATKAPAQQKAASQQKAPVSKIARQAGGRLSRTVADIG